MDYTAEIENVKNELRTLGFDDEKINQLMDLAAQEAIDTAILDLQDKDENTLNQLSQEMVSNPTNAEDAMANINKVFVSAYGDQAKVKKQEFVLNYMKDTLQQTKIAKNLLTKYQAGDPTAIAIVKAQEGNPNLKKIVDALKNQ